MLITIGKERSFNFIFGLFLIILFGEIALSQPTPKPAIINQPQTAQHRALLVGISQYEIGTNPKDNFGHLNTEQDLIHMDYVLRSFYEFSDILTIKDKDATQENIIKNFRQHLIDKAKPGDTLVFYYTGHGHQIKDVSGDENTDGLDEALVTWVPSNKLNAPDEERHSLMYMLDDTYQNLLRELAQKMRGADGKVAGSITVIFDSCHSGSATKAPLVAKGRDWNDKIDGPKPAIAVKEEAASGWLNDKKGDFEVINFISASQSGQLSYMMRDSAKDGSILTYYLTEYLTNNARNKTDNITYKDLFDAVSVRTSAIRGSQNPQIEGNMNALLFDGRVVIKPRFPKIAGRISKPNEEPIILELSEGSLHNVTSGSTYALYKNGKDVAKEENKLGEFEITEVNSIKSVGKITKKSLPALKTNDFLAAQAVEIKHRFEGSPLKVFIQSGLTADKIKLFTDVAKDAAFLTTNGAKENDYDVKLVFCTDNKDFCKDNSGNYYYQRASGRIIWLGKTPDVNSLRKRLLADWRWQKFANLTLPGAPLVRIKLTKKDGSPFERTEGGRIVLKPGDEGQMSVTNNTGKPMFITILYLKDSGEIETIPGPKVKFAQQALNSSNKPQPIFDFNNVTADGKEVEVFRLIATSGETDFSGLNYTSEERENLPKGPKNPLEELLFGIADGEAKSIEISPRNTDNWFTDQIIYEIDPK